jgi:hypothetical protein
MGDVELKKAGRGGWLAVEGAVTGSPVVVVPNLTVTRHVVVLGNMRMPCVRADPFTYIFTTDFYSGVSFSKQTNNTNNQK